MPSLGQSNLTRVAMVAASIALSGPAFADGFNALAGSWSGGGTIQMSNGNTEKLRCRANYNVGSGGASVTQDLRCASDSYRVDVQANVTVNGNAIVGTWTETSRGVSGRVSGRLTGSDISAQIAGPTFAAGLSIGTRGPSQSVSIRVNGGDVSSVTLALKKN